MTRVDAHHHVWDLAVRDQPWTRELPLLRRSFAFDELRPQLDAAGVGATVLVQTVAVAAETPELLDLQTRHPEIAGVVGWVRLEDPAVADRLAELMSGPGRLVGIRHLVQDEPVDYLRRADVRRGIAAVGVAGPAYDLLLTPPHLPAAVVLARSLPQVRFVLDHGAKPLIAAGTLDPWRRDVEALAACPNVAVKLSGLVTEAGPGWTTEMLAPYADVLLDAFGPARVMIGSDWPVCLLVGSYAGVIGAADALTARLTADERVAVQGRTAREWYRLPDPTGRAVDRGPG